MSVPLLIAHAGSGGVLSATFLGGVRDENYTLTTGTTYASKQYSTSGLSALPSGTSLVLVVIGGEKVKGVYDGPNNDITDGSNTWTRVAAMGATGSLTDTNSQAELRFVTCELSSLPSNFTVHYNDSRARAINTSWYAIQNYKSATPRVTLDSHDNNGFTSPFPSHTVSTSPFDFVVSALSEDKQDMPAISGGTQDFYTTYRDGSAGNVTFTTNSEIASGASVTHSLQSNIDYRDGVFMSVSFR